MTTDTFACGRIRTNRRTHRRAPEKLVIQETVLLTRPLLAWIPFRTGLLTLDDGRRLSFGKVGGSDYLAIRRYDGKFVAVEFKAHGKKRNATPQQLDFLDAVRLSKGIGVVADCVEDVLNAVIGDLPYGLWAEFRAQCPMKFELKNGIYVRIGGEHDSQDHNQELPGHQRAFGGRRAERR